jgi:hypothetical protein
MRRHLLRGLFCVLASVLVLFTSVFLAAVAWKQEQTQVGPAPVERNGVHGYAYLDPEHLFWSGEDFNLPTGSKHGPDGPRPWVTGQEDAPRVMLRVTTRSFGWPFRALEYNLKLYWVHVPETYYRGTRETEVHDALVVRLPRSGSPVNVPVGVRGWSAVLDIASYTAALYVGMAAFLIARSVRRRRNGRCRACGYDRGGLVIDTACPECGTAPAAARSAG